MNNTQIILIEYIVKTPDVLGGRARIAERRIAVDHVVHAHIYQNIPIGEFCEAFDVTPAEVYAALTYYYDNKDQIDDLIKASDEVVPPPEPRVNREELLYTWQERSGYAPLQEMTVTEVAMDYGIKEQTIRKACKEGWVSARKSGSTWLIRRAVAHNRWGNISE